MKSNLIPLMVLISTVLGKLVRNAFQNRATTSTKINIIIIIKEPNQECQFCREGIKFLFDNLIDPEVLEEEQQYLVETVCNVLEDPSRCEIGINTWWNKIAITIFNQDFSIEVCRMIVENCLNIRWVYVKSEIHSNLDMANKSVRPFLFTISNDSLYQM